MMSAIGAQRLLEAAIFQGLAPQLQRVAAPRRPCIQTESAVVRQRHVPRHRHVAPANQPNIRDGVMGGATR
jgi:hypothetical protein